MTLLLEGGNLVTASADPNMLDYLTTVMADGRDEVAVFATATGSIAIRSRAILGFIR